jgi:hypothetical protein
MKVSMEVEPMLMSTNEGLVTVAACSNVEHAIHKPLAKGLFEM